MDGVSGLYSNFTFVTGPHIESQDGFLPHVCKFRSALVRDPIPSLSLLMP